MTNKLLTALCLLGISTNLLWADKPNIILLFADDISARELPIYGSTVWSSPVGGGLTGGDTSDPKYRAETPNLDKMATEGCYFKTAWASTICGPSRAMMMTGRYAHLHKWWHNSEKGKSPSGRNTWKLYESSPHTIAHVAKKGGYGTYWAGKTQMDEVTEFGFDEGCLTPGSRSYNERISTTDFALINEGGKIINTDTDMEISPTAASSYVQSGWYWYPHVELMNHPQEDQQLVWWPTNSNHTAAKDTFGLNTFGPDVELEFIFEYMDRKSKADEPFFVYHTSHLGHDAFDFLHISEENKWPGTPIVTWDGTKYSRTTPNITGDNGVYNTNNTVTEDGIHTHVKYLDYQVWRYMNKLKELGIENETIFIFCADNGTSGYGKGNHSIQKGTHVPLIIYAPGLEMSKQGEQKVEVDLSDILPTIADIAGVKMPEDYELNGKSLYKYLFTNVAKHREYIYSYQRSSQLVRGSYVLRDGQGNWYDITTDPADLISFKLITDWDAVSEAHRVERDKLLAVLPPFSQEESGLNAPATGYPTPDPMGFLSQEEIDELNADLTTHINNSSAVSIQLAPNPAGNYFRIHGAAPGQLYEILDQSGKLYQAGSLAEDRVVSVQDLPEGMYFLIIANQTLKIIVN